MGGLDYFVEDEVGFKVGEKFLTLRDYPLTRKYDQLRFLLLIA